jgi:hypothetical protein
VTGRGHGMTGRVWSVAAAVRRGSLGFCTSASGHLQDRRSGQTPRGTTEREGLIRRSGVSGQSRSNVSGREKPSLDPFCTQTGHNIRSSSAARPVGASRAQALCDRHVRSVERRVRSLDDRWGTDSTVEILRSSFEGEDTWTATGDRTQCSASGHIDRRI